MKFFIANLRWPLDEVDTLGIVGVSGISYGAWLAWHPAGFLAGGSLILAAAVLKGLARK